MIGEEVTVLRATVTTDAYNNDQRDWSDPDEYVLAGCAIAPSSTSEDNNGRTAVVTGLTVYATPEAATGAYGWTAYGDPLVIVLATDRLRIRGHVYEVVGEIGEWVDPFDNQTEGVEIQTQKVVG